MDAEEGAVECKCLSIRLHDDGMRRSDTYRISRFDGDHERGWGTFEIAVDDKTYRLVIPSSLY